MEETIAELRIFVSSFTSSLNENTIFASKVIGFFLAILLGIFLVFLTITVAKKIFRGVKDLLMAKEHFTLGTFTKIESDNFWSRCIETLAKEKNTNISATAEKIDAFSSKGKQRCILHLERRQILGLEEKQRPEENMFQIGGSLYWDRKRNPASCMGKETLQNLVSN